MFVFATADIALVSYRFLIIDIPAVLRLETDIDSVLPRLLPKNPLFVTNNLLADGLLVGLLAKFWGYLSQTIPTFSVASTFTPVFFWSVLAFNIVMTAATAGRIWWLSSAGRPILGEQQIKRYSTAVAVLVESGIIYPISILLTIAIPKAKFYQQIFVLITFRIVGIVTALMIVQVELKRQSAQEQSHKSTVTNSIGLRPFQASSASTRPHSFSTESTDGALRRASINFPIQEDCGSEQRSDTRYGKFADYP
ncbi:hypothetical protein Hypma_005555 [Hypsizygus marmoreus]|uniref:Uncharacterized protein n=1 Tax=Hypsizygus marmoreus TaxID=39966 RepID=A0A369K4F7_HYPMA|nr:hypothetical protein Hypma_005555 [Hypsizygus marmoreus]